MTTGRLIGVVGPSGVGKDSVMEELVRARPGFHRVRRVITRPQGEGGEDFDRVSPDEFARRREAGEFVLYWSAHGMDYGVPVGVRARLDRGETCLVNLSRGVLMQAERQFADFITLHLTAPPDALARRLAARGRESRDSISARLARSSFALPGGLGRVIEVSNDGPLEDTVTTILTTLQQDANA
ncbi:phosphonate metabolism protein/1,5-bisphosphokinase (PRPP-forming) PhnN [Roseovarius salis]|uniref:phosphonate metabolism protein/1,5-bisphosphokinase (PRPP-forming) PhnN n=1 Tax=Roseovarius salis TaxID=3376063 RepID=UPI0037CB0D8A